MKLLKCRVCSMPNGLMAFWEEIEEAAVYHVHLIIGDLNKRQENGRILIDEEKVSEIALVDVQREFKYHSFTDLAAIQFGSFRGTTDRDSGLSYYIVVEAEDRTGKIVAKSDRIKGIVKDIANAVNGLASGVYL